MNLSEPSEYLHFPCSCHQAEEEMAKELARLEQEEKARCDICEAVVGSTVCFRVFFLLFVAFFVVWWRFLSPLYGAVSSLKGQLMKEEA